MSKNVLLGIGNSLRSDDGAGPFIAQNFKKENWLVINGSNAPENYASVIKKEHPGLILMVDSVEMGLEAGSIRIIPLNKIVSLQLSTHYLSLTYLIEYLSPYCKNIIFIGIQPQSTMLGENLSNPVAEACQLVISLLENDQLDKIPTL